MTKKEILKKVDEIRKSVGVGAGYNTEKLDEKASQLAFFHRPVDGDVVARSGQQTLTYRAADDSIVCATNGIETKTTTLTDNVLLDVLAQVAYHYAQEGYSVGR